MTRRPLTLMLLAVALAGCVQAGPISVALAPVEPQAPLPQAVPAPVVDTVTATGRLAPTGIEGRSLLAIVSGWTSADIDHVDLTLSIGGTLVTTLTVAQADLTNQVSFTNLKKTTAYSILARAYRTGDSSAPIDHATVSPAGCTTTFTTTSDAAVSIGNIALQLTTKTFSGAGTAAITPTSGSVSNSGGAETISYLPRAFTISTVAGTGVAGTSGDGGAATSAKFQQAMGVAIDSAGNIYVADYGANVVRKIDKTTGIISLVAGSGAALGDGGLATSAKLLNPRGLAVDTAGNLYIADRTHHRVRKVDTAGIITTVAGTSTGFSGDGGLATNAQLSDPFGVTVDGAGNLYIADFSNNRIRKVTAANGVISTVVGGGGSLGDNGAATLAKLSNPGAVTLDTAGNLYIVDTYQFRIRKVNTSQVITTVAGTGGVAFTGDGGAATLAQVNSVTGVAVDSVGNLYIADTGNNRVRKVNSAGVITTVAGGGATLGDSGPGTSAKLVQPNDVAVDATGAVYIVDTQQYRIRKLQ